MLVLSRKKNESIMIGGGNSGLEEIVLMIVEIRGDKVRLGVEASTKVSVYRRENYEAIKRNEEAIQKGKPGYDPDNSQGGDYSS